MGTFLKSFDKSTRIHCPALENRIHSSRCVRATGSRSTPPGRKCGSIQSEHRIGVSSGSIEEIRQEAALRGFRGASMLIYDIQSEWLQGDVGNRRFRIHAVSGGGRGSRLNPEGDQLIRSWSPGTKENQKNGIRGGIIPPGFYTCRHVPNHPKFGECIFLEQTITSLFVGDPGSPAGLRLHGRDGFYIHGAGPKGSDGCIVISNKEDRSSLNRAIQHHNGTPLRAVNPYLPDELPAGRRTALA
jgi:hypothetical protein